MSEFFGVKCGWALDCFDSQAQLRDDRLYAAEKQRDLDLSFTTKSRAWAGTRLEDELAPDGMQRKLTIGGHYGQGSASTRANGLDSTKELPCPQTNSLIEELVEKNAIQWTALFDALREAVAKEFQNDPIDKKTYANVKDFLFSGTSCWRDFLFTSNEVHIQSVGRRAPAPRRRASNGDAALDGGGDQAVGGEARVALPEHYDGGRGFIILAISLWTTRIVRMWLSDGTVVEMRTGPGHCYLANFVGVQHQVLHAADGAEAGRGHTHTHQCPRRFRTHLFFPQLIFPAFLLLPPVSALGGRRGPSGRLRLRGIRNVGSNGKTRPPKPRRSGEESRAQED